MTTRIVFCTNKLIRTMNRKQHRSMILIVNQCLG